MEGKRFARSKNSMIFGVCAGLAEYFAINVTAMRIMWVAFALITWLFMAFAAYVALAFIMMPPEGSPATDRFWHHVDGRNIVIVFAIILMCIGCYIIVKDLLGINLFRYVFPVGLIVTGGLLFAFAFGNNNQKKE